MAINYANLQASTAALIKNMGTAVTITSAATGKVIKTYAVYTDGTDQNETSDQFAKFSKLTVGTEVCFIGVTKVPPLPGDTVISKNRSHVVQTVQSYCPADIVIAYQLGLE